MSDGGEGREAALRAHAKVNLRLRVFGRDESGYHGLETLFLRLELADTVRIAEGGRGIGLRLVLGEGVPPGSVPGGQENLCVQAAEAWMQAAREVGIRTPGGVEIHLEKRIPAGSGLGGGSADAAAVLRLLNGGPAGGLPPERLLRIAGGLGSDVPFGLLPGPSALGWARGNRLLPLPPPPQRPALAVLPGVGIATSDAYAWLDGDRASAERGRAPPDGDRAPGDGEPGPPVEGDGAAAAAALPPPEELSRWETLAALAANDFEAPVFRRHPEIREARRLAARRATAALLAGSGDAVVGIYPDADARDRAARRVVEECGFRVRRTRTVSSPAGPAGDRWPLV